MDVYIASDHRGFNLKKELVEHLKDNDINVFDLGASSMDPNDDYPTFASKVSQEIIKNSGSLGVLLCGSGVGIDIAANKFDGIRASIGINSEQVAAGKRDDNLNVLVIAADFTSLDEAKNMLKTFLNTKYEKNERHERRIKEVASFEERK